jgi:allantoinase
MPSAASLVTKADTQPPRDLVGYGRVPPTFNLPNGAKIAVNFVINYEEGGESE